VAKSSCPSNGAYRYQACTIGGGFGYWSGSGSVEAIFK